VGLVRRSVYRNACVSHVFARECHVRAWETLVLEEPHLQLHVRGLLLMLGRALIESVEALGQG